MPNAATQTITDSSATVQTETAPQTKQIIPADARPVSEVMKADSIKKTTQAAMPKDDDWDLPENFNSENAFVPIEADAE